MLSPTIGHGWCAFNEQVILPLRIVYLPLLGKEYHRYRRLASFAYSGQVVEGVFCLIGEESSSILTATARDYKNTY